MSASKLEYLEVIGAAPWVRWYKAGKPPTNIWFLPDPTGCLSHGGSWWIRTLGFDGLNLDHFWSQKWGISDPTSTRSWWFGFDCVLERVGSLELGNGVRPSRARAIFFLQLQEAELCYLLYIFLPDFLRAPKQKTELTYLWGFVCIKIVRNYTFFQQRKYVLIQFYSCMGVSLNGATPISHPKMITFSRKIHGCWVPPF